MVACVAEELKQFAEEQCAQLKVAASTSGHGSWVQVRTDAVKRLDALKDNAARRGDNVEEVDGAKAAWEGFYNALEINLKSAAAGSSASYETSLSAWDWAALKSAITPAMAVLPDAIKQTAPGPAHDGLVDVLAGIVEVLESVVDGSTKDILRTVLDVLIKVLEIVIPLVPSPISWILTILLAVLKAIRQLL